MKARPDLAPEAANSHIEVIQLTDGDAPHAHVYMEAQIFTPDAARFVLHRTNSAHGGGKRNPDHQYLLCDIEDGCSLQPLTSEHGATAPSLSPDGQVLYYFVDQTNPTGGSLALNRVRLDGTQRRTLLVVDTPIGTPPRRPSYVYPLSTIRSDGRKLALSCFLGDGKTEQPPWGLMVFDLEGCSVEIILAGPDWCNVHPQYCRSTDDAHKRDILIQQNHGSVTLASGKRASMGRGKGGDVHVVKDDGTDFRDMPWGRDPNEDIQGHQCWRGTSGWAITSTKQRAREEQELIESKPVAHADHAGLNSPGAIRNNLSRGYPDPAFYHFATDRAGARLVTDTHVRDQGGRVFVAKLGAPGKQPLSDWTCIARPRSSWQKEAHIHPFLSPDGSRAFFNSDESGRLQAYMVRGFERL